MIFAAGLGTRLLPLTENTPKALITIQNKTLLEIAINNLIHNGFDDIIINVHHFAEQIINYLGGKSFDAEIQISDESKKLLDTGGGLKKAMQFFNDGNPFLVYNVDVITNLNLNNVYITHKNSDFIATLVIRNRDSGRYLLFDENNLLQGWKNVKSGEIITTDKNYDLKEFAFSGIHIVNPEIFSFMPTKNKFSMIDLYLSIMNIQMIGAYLDNKSYWMDAGTPNRISEAENNFLKFVR